MVVASPAAFVDLLRQNHLVDASLLEELDREETGGDTMVLVKRLVRQGWVTRFQVQELWQGRGAGLVLGPYRILDRLGEGAMGQVLKARHQILQRLVALKILRAEMLPVAEAQRRFLREAQAAARLTHPNIVTLYDAGEINGTHFLAMELIDGKDLSRTARESGPLPVARACDYLRQVAEGLSHAHARGLVHRDIKPSNLLVARESGVVKILDMGLARFNTPSIFSDTSGTLTREGSVLGTFDYLAPEQAKNAREVDARADLYSLGCTFYHLIGGKPPFPDGPGLDKLIRHQTEEPPPLSSLRGHVPARVAALIHKLMAKRPEDRYASGKDVVEAVRELGLVETMAAPDALLLDEVLPVLEGEASTVVQQPTSPKTPVPRSRRKPPTRIHTPRLKTQRAPGLPKFVWFLAGGGVGMAALIFLILLLAVLASKGPKPSPGAVPTESAERRVTTPLKK